MKSSGTASSRSQDFGDRGPKKKLRGASNDSLGNEILSMVSDCVPEKAKHLFSLLLVTSVHYRRK